MNPGERRRKADDRHVMTATRSGIPIRLQYAAKYAKKGLK
jgi:hypothetical protein